VGQVSALGTDLASFAAYLNRNARTSACDVLISEKCASADLQPGECSGSTVTCDMAYHPRFRRWREACGKGLTQRQFLAIVTAARGDFAPQKATNGADAGTEGDTLASNLMRMTVKKDEVYESEVDERGTIRFRSGAGRVDVGGAIPGRFTVRVPVFLGVEGPDGTEPTYPLEIMVQLDVETAPVFTLSAPGVDLVVLDALNGARAFLESKLEKDFLVGAGERRVATVPVPLQ
jgi:hypothetical protein